jgi:CO/xanthine dehydrogenase Mo-binding subunit
MKPLIDRAHRAQEQERAARAKMTRRQFGQAVGSLVISFSLVPHLAAAADAPARLPGSLNNNRMLDAWLRIEADGSATIFPGKVELGQGAVTALVQIAAEELDLPFHRVHPAPTETGASPDEGVTSGSQSMESGGTALRFACAEARAILLDRAAAKLGIAVEKLKTEKGFVLARGSKRISYGALVAGDVFHKEASGKVAPKNPTQYRIVGTPVPRLDIPAKVSGGAAYVHDMRLPGMLFGRVARPPIYRAALTDVDQGSVSAMPGVVAVVVNGDFLGVIAAREEQAIAARTALLKNAKWTQPPDLPDSDRIHDWLKHATLQDNVISSKSADAPQAAKYLEASFTRPFLSHGPIGPSCAVAQFHAPDRLQIWSHSQGIYPLRQDLAKALDMPPAAITVSYVEGSGCYGQDSADDVALDAALLARAAGGRPVKLQLMREDEFAWEPYGPAMVSNARAGLSADGHIVDWQYELWSNTHNMRPGAPDGVNLLAAWYYENPKKAAPPRNLPQPSGGGDRNALPLYDFPNQKVTNHLVIDMPLRVSALRTLGGYHNVFALESFMDELALAAGVDAVEFRLRHLKDPRAKAVIEAAAKKAGWKHGTNLAQGNTAMHGRGIGFAKYKNLATYVAVIADVAVDAKTGAIRVARLVAVADAGLIINPNGLANQIQGGCVQSTSWTLHEQVSFDRRHITSRDWVGYPILTFPEVPEIDVTLLDHPGEEALGAGEAAQGPTAAAIANAVANATGRRIRDLPLSAERVKHALT